MILRQQVLLALLSSSPLIQAADTRTSDSSRPRGVGPEFAKFYKATDKPFVCISNPSIHIPFSQVNDDYCDCPDGSDEPGTAACSYLHHFSPDQPRPGANALTPKNESMALPGFYCKNKGHIPAYVRFENVNDGVCDYDVCCDGSDEYAGVGGVKCEDRCAAIGKEWKKQDEVRAKSMGRAMKKKKELQFEADKRKKEVQEKIDATEIRIQGLERKLGESEENLNEVERKEKMRAVKSDVSGKGTGRLGLLLSLSRDRVQELRDALTKTRKMRDDMVTRVTELEALLTALKEEYNPNFNDAGVKKAVQGWEDYAARESTDTWTNAEDRDLVEIAKEDGSDSGINWSDFEAEEEESSDAAAIYSLTSYLPPPLQSWLGGTISSLRQILIDNGILPDITKSTNVDDSPAVKNARKTKDDTQRDLTNAQNDLKRDRDDLDKDYGPAGIFRALKDTCVEKESGEYKYSHCFMSKTTQQPKKGGGQTNMGNFKGYEVEYVDDDLPADGKGLGRGDRIVMWYEGGQHCWSGPARSTRVVLGCSEVDEIYKISESEKCVYRMEVGTPAVCGWVDQPEGEQVDGAEQPKLGTAKDEL
ncbi:hypothetical protein LTR70_007941 [Exophiala xenobiotica]|uniref:Glucosidase 2 subunit beta n=1 Tax=Lithohypha guttulata TaxID=1690604 RepID=A0ABR0K2V1_9EURO|nr:hypothetical protein LTR24_007509 [Lithohypha guttulata]KAK5312859.1 hypothetical protein LTR70_007941 [Exophiala xenobiotica]